jgi:hypothetical protein
MPSEAEHSCGALVVSLDVDRIGDLDAIRRVVDLFAEREIHASWALHARSFAAEEPIATIAARPHQELALHLSVRAVPFEDELAAAVALAQRSGFAPGSASFSHDEYDREHLQILARHGITAYRGRQRGFVHSNSKLLAKLRAGLRLADNFSLLLPDAATSLQRIRERPRGQPINIPGSRLLRPYDPRLRQLEPLRVHRLQSEMTYAAEAGRVYHLWMHPQDFALHTHEDLEFLDHLLRNARALAGRVGFRSLTMGELASAATTSSPPFAPK